MKNNIITIKEMTGTRLIKGKRIPRSIGKIRDVVFYPDKKCVAGFVTKQSDFLFIIKRKGHFVSIKGYYLYEDLAFVQKEKGSRDKAAYKLLGLEPDECVTWLGLPVITEDGRTVGVVSDVAFTHQNGEVQSIEAGPKAVGKLLQGTRTIPTSLIKGYRKVGDTALAPVSDNDESNSESTGAAILVSNEAMDIDIDSDKAFVSKVGKQASAVAHNAGVDAAAVSEKAKSAAKTAGAVVDVGVKATGEQLKKTKGMFSAFKEEYNKARHDDQ